MAAAETAARPPLRILLIEDSEFDARIVASLLRGGGYDVTSRRVETAPAMREALATQPWDIVFSDHQMPEFDAAQALRVLQESGLDLPFIIVSGGIGEETAVALMKAGAHDFLMKGQLGRLLPAVQRELREAGVRADRRASELRYRRLWETSPDAILMMDEQGGIAFVNPAAEAVFGLPAANLTTRNFASLLAEGEAGMAAVLAAGSESGRASALPEIIGRHASGRRVVMEVAFNDTEMQGRRWLIAFIRDITARREAERRLQLAEQEFGLAREIQQRLFPKQPPSLPGYDIAGASFPAIQTGGDAFDFLSMPEGDLGLVVSDVSGHGMGPALIMAATRAYLRIVAFNRRDAGLVFNRANQVLAEDLEGSTRFVTALLLRLSPDERCLGYVNAGHTTGYVLGADGRVRHTLPRNGPPLGLDAETTYTENGGLALETGDVVLMLTDGFIETEAPRASAADAVVTFGEERLLAVARAHRTRPAKEIIAAVRTAAEDFRGSGDQEDDLTLVVVKVL